MPFFLLFFLFFLIYIINLHTINMCDKITITVEILIQKLSFIYHYIVKTMMMMRAE